MFSVGKKLRRKAQPKATHALVHRLKPQIRQREIQTSKETCADLVCNEVISCHDGRGTDIDKIPEGRAVRKFFLMYAADKG
jgi:hypothetical protein